MRGSTFLRPVAHRRAIELFWPFEGRRFESQKTEVPLSISLHDKASATRRGNAYGGRPTHPHSRQGQAPSLHGHLYLCLASVKTEAGPSTIYDPELVFTGPVHRKPAMFSAVVATCPSYILQEWAAGSSLSPTVAVRLLPPGIWGLCYFFTSRRDGLCFLFETPRETQKLYAGTWALPSSWSVNSRWSQVNHAGVCQWAFVVSLSVLKDCTPAQGLEVPSNLVSYDSMIKCHRAEIWSLTTSNPIEFSG